MMHRKLTLALILLSTLLSTFAFAQTESTLYTFSETSTFWPNGTLLEDSKGNFYGTTRGGGAYGMGTVFEFSPPAVVGGAWVYTTLYSFIFPAILSASPSNCRRAWQCGSRPDR